MGVHYVIISHSERRNIIVETNAILAEKKLDRAFESGIQPIFCCGEPLSVREAGTKTVMWKSNWQKAFFRLEASVERFRHCLWNHLGHRHRKNGQQRAGAGNA